MVLFNSSHALYTLKGFFVKIQITSGKTVIILIYRIIFTKRNIYLREQKDFFS